MSKRCYIAGAGEFCENTLPGHEDYIIAANGGYAALKSRGISPDLIVGDFDSVPPAFSEEISSHPNVQQSPAEKDDTDMMLAVKKGLDRGYKFFIINGGLGGRLDQTYANIQILTYIAEQNARGVLLGKTSCVTVIKDGCIKLTPEKIQDRTISVFCAGSRAEGVTLKGLKYILDNAVISNNYPIGVSNEFIGETADISVTNGILLIIWSGGMLDIC